MRIARVFATKTNMSPADPDAYFDEPGLFTPHYDLAMISVVFTWDIPKANRLKEAWRTHATEVLIGGPAINGESRDPFVAGRFLRPGVTIGSRGCNKVGCGPGYCRNCRVSKGLIEFDDFPAGYILQDNNLLQCSDRHIGLVLAMLESQKGIKFAGGLDKYLLTDRFVNAIKDLSVQQIFLACDNTNEIEALKAAVVMLSKAGFNRHKVYCYTVVGKDMVEEEARCRAIWKTGATPFAQLFRDPEGKIKYSRDYKLFVCAWSRPAIINTRAKYNWTQIKHHSQAQNH